MYHILWGGVRPRGDQDTQDAVLNGIYPFYVRSPIIEKSNKRTFEGEAILMAGDGVGAGKIFHHAFGKIAIHQRVYCSYDFRQIDSNFLYYYISNLFSLEIEKGSAMSTVASVRLPMLKDFVVVFPKLETQTSIVNYLDAKCAQIDSIISEMKSCIEEYKQWKSAIIFEAVTKGLNPNVEMKNSGVAWIGEIPKEWNTIKIKNVAYLKGRIGWQGLESKEYQKDGAFLITGTDFESGIVNWNTCVHISEQRYYEDKLLHIKENDLPSILTSFWSDNHCADTKSP